MLPINHPIYQSIKKAVEYFQQNNISITKCAKMFNIHRETLTKYLKMYDMHEDRRSYYCDVNYFESVDNEEKAYWLGFITADGCLKNGINQLSIGLSIKDINHLEKFKIALSSEHPIKHETTFINEKMYKTCALRIQSKKMYNDLFDLNIRPNKSMNEIPSNVDDNLIPHYIRGIFDGDGWLSWNNNCAELGFGMGEVILDYIRNSFESIGVKQYDIKPYKSIYRYRLTSKIEMRKALEYLYKDASVYLDRKYEKYLNFCRLEPKLQKTQDD